MKRGLTSVLVLAALGGCSSGSEGSGEQGSAARKQVSATLSELESDTRRRRYGHICQELFTRAARRRAGGSDCAKLLRDTAGEVRDPSITVLSVRMRAGKAVARVRTRAAGQGAIEETIELRRERGRYRIAALAG